MLIQEMIPGFLEVSIYVENLLKENEEKKRCNLGLALVQLHSQGAGESTIGTGTHHASAGDTNTASTHYMNLYDYIVSNTITVTYTLPIQTIYSIILKYYCCITFSICLYLGTK